MTQIEKLKWSDLTHLQVGKYAEYFVKMEFTKYRFDVYTSEVDDKGIDFVVCKKSHEQHFDVQVKSICKSSYIFFRKEYFVPRDNLFAAIVIFPVDEKSPQLYLIPSLAWTQPNNLLVSYDFGPPKKSKAEWGINLSRKSYLLLEEYSFEKIINSL